MSSAANLYHSVISDVVSSMRDSFLDDGVDENVLQELKQLWATKLEASKTIEQPTVHNSNTKRSEKRANIAPRTGGAATTTGTAAASSVAAGTAPQQLVITDPTRLVPVQITIPANPANPSSRPRALTVQVPAHALQSSGSTTVILQQVLTTAITKALTLPESHAGNYLQQQINNAFKLPQ